MMEASEAIKVSGAILCDLYDFIYFIELSLSWNAFMRYHDCLPFNLHANTKAIHAAIEEMVDLFGNFDYQGGVEHNTIGHVKPTHTCIASIITLSMGIGCNITVAWEKVWAKGASRTAQKHGSEKFLQQTTERVFDSLVLSKVLQVGRKQFESNTVNNPEVEASNVYLRENAAKFKFNTLTKEIKCTSKSLSKRLHPFAIEQLVKHFQGRVATVVTVYTEAKLLKENQVLRACLGYDNNGSWLDWVQVVVDSDILPARVLGFFKDTLTSGVFAIVSISRRQIRSEMGSRLVKEWAVGVIDSVEIIDIHRIKEVILGIEKYEGLSSEVQSRTVLTILNRKHSWPQIFIQKGEEVLERRWRAIIHQQEEDGLV
jgi:hypothetical protein